MAALSIISLLASCTVFFSIGPLEGYCYSLDYETQYQAHAESAKSGCDIKVSEGLPDAEPLIVSPGSKPEFVFPDQSGIIHLNTNDVLRLVCTGGRSELNIAETSNAEVQCVSGKIFLVPTPSGNVNANFSDLTCTHIPYDVARNQMKEDVFCIKPNVAIEIGFMLPEDGNFLRVIDACFNHNNLSAIYTRFDLPWNILGFQKDVYSPGYRKGIFYGSLDVDELYTRNNQRATISKILRSTELGNKYINQTGDYFLSRGHLAAKADFIYAAQQRSTFYYVNVAPQWQTLNGNNWKTLEIDLRNFAASSKTDLQVWTGTYGAATLPDVDNHEQPLYLYLDVNNTHQVEVPALFWKVALEPQSSFAVAFVSVNNPYLNPVPKSLILCQDICNKLKWLTWSPKNITKGFSYCCEVGELQRRIENIPKIKVLGILGSGGSQTLRMEVKVSIMALLFVYFSF